jgi:hypothetical protein
MLTQVFIAFLGPVSHQESTERPLLLPAVYE